MRVRRILAHSPGDPCGLAAVVRGDTRTNPWERLTLAGFLAGCSGPTRDSHRTDLRLFTVWLTDPQVQLLEVQRTHIEQYGHWVEEQGRARSQAGHPAPIRTRAAIP